MCATRPRVCFVAVVSLVFWLVCTATTTEGFECVEPAPVHSTNTCYQGVKLSANSSTCLGGHYSCESWPEGFVWTPVNISIGVFEVSFPLASPGCNFDQYSLTLKVLPDTHPHPPHPPHLPSQQQECQNSIRNSFTQIHTKREYNVENATVCGLNNSAKCPVCGKTGLVRFQFVFSGCYQLVITPKTGPITHQAIHSCAMFLETTYKKALISTEKPAFAILQEQDQQAPVKIRFKFGPLTCSCLELVIKLVKNVNLSSETPCYKTGRLHSQCTIRHDKTSCVESEAPGIPNADCKIDADQVICSLKPISEGNYCAIMKILDDDRCAVGTLWTPKHNGRKPSVCAWHDQFIWHGAARSGVKSFPAEDSSEHSFALVAGVGLMIATFTLALIAVWVKFRYLNRSMGLSNQARCSADGLVSTAALANGANGVAIEGVAGGGGVGVRATLPFSSQQGRGQGVLLLYARDCEPFMKVMQSFRRLLEDAFKLEVYDCFEPSRWDQICRSPTEWMRRCALHPQVKVIAVASTCGSLRLRAQQQLTDTDSTRLQYAEPSFVDDLFLYGVQLLGENVHRLRDNGYQKMFVVRLDGFSEDEDLFTHLNTYTRYVLPAHLNLLGSHLNPSSVDQSLLMMEHDQVQPFRQDLNKLVNFKNENLYYLEDFLLMRK